jgi:hypothetical protein
MSISTLHKGDDDVDGDDDDNVTVLWNQAVHTDREVPANGPDIIFKIKIFPSKTIRL